jgi:hypothetical protein
MSPTDRSHHHEDRESSERTIERPASEEQRDSSVLNLMFCNASWPWSVAEIARELQDHGGAVDAVARLTEAGLVHCLGEFVFPTRTARRANELGVGSV